MHASFGPRRLNRLAVLLLVQACKAFETPKIVPAIKHTESFGIDLRNGDMEMRTAVLDVPDNEPRAICPDIKFGIDRFHKDGQLRGRHLPLRGNRPVPQGISATFHRREGMSIMERGSVASQHLDSLILV